MDVRERMRIMLKLLYDSEFRRSVRTYKLAEKMYAHYAASILGDLGILKILKQPHELEEISRLAKIENLKMLEYMLDLLVGQESLDYVNGEYLFIKNPAKFSKKDENLLKGRYPYSWKWTQGLLELAKEALLHNKKFDKTGFDDEEWMLIWEGIMDEAPASFRRMAIKKCLKYLPEGATILDMGCGSGVGLQEFLLNANKNVKLIGIDGSQNYLSRAKIRLENLYNTTKNNQIKNNLQRVELIHRDLRKQGLPNNREYDAIFLSIVLNHIPKQELEPLFISIQNHLNKGGIVVIYQLIHKSKFQRVPMWPMEIIPTHKEYPYKDEYLNMLSKVFKRSKVYLDGVIVVCKNSDF